MKIWNKRDPNCPKEAVHVGRPSKWGNPMSLREVKRLFPYISKAEARQRAIEWYKSYILCNKELLGALSELKGKDLVCWCAPLPCHADILLELANKPIQGEPQSVD